MKRDTEMKEYEQARRRQKRWQWAAALLACAAALGVVWLLILPAQTAQQASCSLPEHIHGPECYTQVTVTEKRVPICTPEILGLHTHGPDCYDGEGKLICGLADSVAHTHDEACCGENGELWCPLPETEGHIHTDDCYASADPVHTHTEDCYALTRGELTCTQHVHTEACFTEVAELVCTQEESEGHTHGGGCMDAEGNLTCTLPESAGHTHGTDCQRTVKTQICGEDGDHQHDDGCYEQVETLICEISTEPAAPALVCGQTELPRHQHGQACFRTVEEPADTESLTCTNTEENHVHSEQCYGTWILTCDLEEHTHDESCQPEQAPEAEAPTPETRRVRELAVLPQAEEVLGQTWLVRNDGRAVYEIRIQTEAYTQACDGPERVRLELVLPLSVQEGGFDLDAMGWLEQPQLTEESRVWEDQSLPCQVLTGYRTLQPEEGDGFSETAAVLLKDAQPGKQAAVLVSAAMENNAWEGVCQTHQTEERLTVTADSFTAACSEAEAQSCYQQYLEEVEALEHLDVAAGEALLARLGEALASGQLTQALYAELYEMVFTRMYGSPQTIAERAVGANWMALRDSGWFEAYSGAVATAAAQPARIRAVAAPLTARASTAPSDVQIDSRGGSESNPQDGVTVSKTIAGTELENVFDITLQVRTTRKISEMISQPDMAVVIVMDISNTMNNNFNGVTRYAAAMNAAESFLDQFAQHNSQGLSKVGYVAFNTDAHQIFGMQTCQSAAQASALKNTMRTKTGSIINAAGYAESHSRFTNIEAGLAMAWDMLSGVSNKYKYIVFLSDGFPTTYIQSGYTGHDPYGTSGGFYDHVLNKPCRYGTSYSNQSAVKASDKAKEIKKAGITIFSIGVDVGGQTIQQYITQSEKATDHSVVDRKDTNYAIGDANSSQAYKNWLKESIGSGHYYDSTDSAGLIAAFNTIFQTIKTEMENAARADWVASDPMPGGNGYVAFLGFYDSGGNLTGDALTGASGTDNTAAFNGETQAIRWDLKTSVCNEATDGEVTTYAYQLRYRVRLENEAAGFGEGTVYPTNGSTNLRYRVVQTVDGSNVLSEPKTIAFPIPSVHGYLSALTFRKLDTKDHALAGAEFTLRHNLRACGLCGGDGSSVAIPDITARSDEQGQVTFSAIPSGHQYTLEETRTPPGYTQTGHTYSVSVAYDALTVSVRDGNQASVPWDGIVRNTIYYELPDTGGAGTGGYGTVGCTLLAFGGVLLACRTRRRKEVPDFSAE